MTDLPDDAALARLLDLWDVPAVSTDFAARVASEATRPDRPRLPPPVPPRGRVRPWTRRGVWTGIVAINIVLASAVAAAFGGGFDLHRLHAAALHLVSRMLPHHHLSHVPPSNHTSAPRRSPSVTHPLAVVPPLQSPPVVRPVIGRPAMRPAFRPPLRMNRSERPLAAHGRDVRRPGVRHPDLRFRHHDVGLDHPHARRRQERDFADGWHDMRPAGDAPSWRGRDGDGWRDRPPTFDRLFRPSGGAWRGGRAGRFGRGRGRRGRF
jgi:hypothetical protein